MAAHDQAPEDLKKAALALVTQKKYRPRVSVVVPAYNEDRYLGSCLASLLQAPAEDFEIVVVDDGSSDRTGAIAAEWAGRDARIRIVRNDSNCGLPRTLNRGFDEARGEILTWISGDNWAGPNFVAGLRGELDANPEIDIVYGDTVICDEAGLPIKTLPREAVERLAQINVIRSCFMFRRRALERAGPYNPRWALVEDYEFWLRCSRAGLPFGFVAGPVVYHRLRSASLTAQFPDQVACLAIEARAWHLRHSLPRNSQDMVRLVKDVMRHLPIRRALRHAVHWTARAPLRQRLRLWTQIFLELAARCLKRARR
jgi:glycosyltransferase involved in cell wall biosynthesis